MSMTSPLAAGDLEDLREEGLTPTDEDIIRLHALAAKITDGTETTAANIPRWATAGGVVFWEPTIAAIFWYEFAKSFADDPDTDAYFFAFACAHGRDHGYLANLRGPDEIERALGAFIGSLACNRDELARAVAYVLSGDDRIRPEPTEIEKQNAKKRQRGPLEPYEKLLEEAAANTGLSYADIIEQTPSRLCGMIEAAHRKDNANQPMSRLSANAHAHYLSTLNAIAKRLREEAAARDR